jgi:hypothetical protein
MKKITIPGRFEPLLAKCVYRTRYKTDAQPKRDYRAVDPKTLLKGMREDKDENQNWVHCIYDYGRGNDLSCGSGEHSPGPRADPHKVHDPDTEPGWIRQRQRQQECQGPVAGT